MLWDRWKILYDSKVELGNIDSKNEVSLKNFYVELWFVIDDIFEATQWQRYKPAFWVNLDPEVQNTEYRLRFRKQLQQRVYWV